MKQAVSQHAAFSMLELVVATAMLSTVMASVVVLIRTTYSAWETHERDLDRTENVYATLRHFVRQARQAESVTDITVPSEIAGRITLLMTDGTSHIWERQADNRVLYGVGAANDLLASDISELTFVGYEADGVTQATNPAEIQIVECRSKTMLLHATGAERTVSCRAWLRAW